METERIDVRKLERAAREQLRRTVVRLFNRGHSQAFIARELGLRRATVASWVGKARAGLDPQESKRGRRVGVGRRLTAAQEARLQQEILDRTPAQRQLCFALWNAQAVRALIKACFLIPLPVRTVRLYLRRWGFTPQRPLQRAFEQQPVAVQ